MQYIPYLDDTQIAQAMANSIKLWGDGTTPAQATERFLKLKNSSPSRLVTMAGILDPNGNVASALKRYSFELDSPSGTLKTVAIGAVFTREEFRNRGFAQTLIENIVNEASECGFKAALLFSDIKPSYYEKMGFQALHDLSWTAEAKFLLKSARLQIRAAETSDLSKLMNWYEDSFSKGYLRYLRPTPEVWNFLRMRAQAFSDYIVSHKGKDIGYFNARATKDNLWIHEFVLPDAELENEFAATLGHFALQNNRDTVSGWLRSDKILNGFVGQSRGKAIPMIRRLSENLKLPETDSQVHFSSIDHI